MTNNGRCPMTNGNGSRSSWSSWFLWSGTGASAPLQTVTAYGSTCESVAVDGEVAEVADQGEGDGFGPEELLGEGLDRGRVDGFDLGDDLVNGEEAAEVHLLTRQVGHAAGGGFEAEHDVALELVFGSLQLCLRDGIFFETTQFLDGEPEDFRGFFGGGAGVDGEGAGVAEGTGLGVDGVGEAAFFADGLEEAAAHAAAEHGVEQEDGVAGGGVDRRRGDTEAKLDLLQGLLALERDVRMGGRGGEMDEGGVAACREAAEAFGDLGDEGVVMEVAGGGKDHVARGKAVGVIVEDGGPGEGGDSLDRAQDGAAEGVTLPEVLGKGFVDEIVGIILVHLDFFEDDAPLAGDVLWGEGGVEQEVGEKVKRWSNIFIQHFDIEADSLLPGEGVEVAADGVGFAGELLGGARGGAFEDHVLDEVGDAIQVERLVAGAGGDPDAHGDGTDLGDRLGENEQAVAQASPANAAGGGWGGGQNGGGFDHAAPCDYCVTRIGCGRSDGGRLEGEKQIPTLRCGMTNG